MHKSRLRQRLGAPSLGSGLALAGLVLLFATELRAHAEKHHRLVACVIDAPGSTKVAAPYLDKLFRAIEAAVGWGEGSLTGLYTPSEKRCVRELRSKKTTLAIISAEVYVAHAKKLRLRPLGIAEMNGAKATRFHVVVKKGAVASLAELAGATLVTNHGGDARFLARVVLGGALGEQVAVQRTREPLRALRSVHKGDARATVLDDGELEKMKLLAFADELQVLHSTTESFPNPIVVAIGTRGGEAPEQVAAKLPALCQGEGKTTCEGLRVTGFSAADVDVLRALVERYRK